jgi:4-carboxymuconolactone decarboxylase
LSPRIPYLEAADAEGEAKAAVERVPKNIVRLVAQAQGVAEPVFGLIGAMLTKLDLDPVLRELTILHVGQSTEAEYEWAQHVPIAERVGVSAAQVAAIERGELEADCFDEKEKATLAFAAAVLATPRPADPIFERLVRSGYSDRETVELILLVGCSQMLAHAMTALDIDLDAVVSAAELDAMMEFMNGDGA